MSATEIQTSIGHADVLTATGCTTYELVCQRSRNTPLEKGVSMCSRELTRLSNVALG